MSVNYKLCIIGSPHWAAVMGGAEYQEKLLVEKLKSRRNLQIYFITSRINIDHIPEGYNIILLDVHKELNKYASFFGTFKLLRILREIKPNVIYQRGGSALIGAAAFYSKRFNCNLIWHLASDSDVEYKIKSSLLHAHRLIDQTLFNYGSRKAKHIIVQTNYQKRVVRSMNYKAEIHFLKNFHPFPVENAPKQKKNQIIWVANFKMVKQPEVFINLSSHLYKKKLDVKCIMIGSPATDRNGYQQLLEKKINDTPNLFWLNKQPIEIVNKYINESKLFVNTSKFEGFPNTYIQAWMRETPVVTITCDPDNLISVLGLGMRSGNFEKLVEDVINLLYDNELRTTMGKQAKKYAFKYHSLENIEKLSEIISK